MRPAKVLHGNFHLLQTCSLTLMFVLALCGQPRRDPIGLPRGVVFDVRVAERRQFTGGRF